MFMNESELKEVLVVGYITDTFLMLLTGNRVHSRRKSWILRGKNSEEKFHWRNMVEVGVLKKSHFWRIRQPRLLHV